jgi:alanine-glyoxylate transaminase/serine-glyoxylate transaminase/serine-pyruvate transaminase
MLNMLIGPTRMAPEVLASMSAQPPPIDDPEFLGVFRDCLEGVRHVHGSETGPCLVAPGTGTAGLEALAQSFVPPGVEVCVVSTGAWGTRWAEICRRGGATVREVVVPARGLQDPKTISDVFERHRCTVLLATHVDSSTGIRLDLDVLGAIAGKYGALSIVDAICSAGCEPLSQQRAGISVVLSSTPKALGVPAGLFMITMNDAARKRLAQRERVPGSFALDLWPWVESMEALERNEFRYHQSPAGNLVAALAVGLRLVQREGLEIRCERHASLMARLHRGLENIGIEVMVQPLSQRASGVTVCLYPEGFGRESLRTVRALGVQLPAGTHQEYGSRTFRIGHLGLVTRADIDRTLEALTETFRSRRAPSRAPLV